MSRDEDFLSRWSRRKRASGEDEAAGEASQTAAPPVLPEHAEGEVSEAELLEKLGLKVPEELQPGDDFSGFMAKAVPEAIRRRALRRLWRSDPVFACLDGLNDYDGDFTGGSVAVGELKTAYKVGRGLVDRLAEADPPAESGTADKDESIDEAPADAVDPAEADPPETALASADSVDAAATPEPDDAAPTRRRMRFRTAPDAPPRS